MTSVYIIQASCIIVIAYGVINRGNFFKYPVLFSVVYCFWFLPQISKINRCISCPDTSQALIFSVFCFVAVLIPWFFSMTPKKSSSERWRRELKNPKEPTLRRFVIILSFIGLLCYFVVAHLERTITLSQWSGPITIFWFFANLLFIFGLLSLFLYHRTRKRVYLVIATIAFVILFYRVIFLGRRGIAIEIFFYISLYLFFCRGIMPSRMLIVVLFPLAYLIFENVGTYRGALQESSVLEAFSRTVDSALLNMDQNIDHRRLEALNAVAIIDDEVIDGDYTHIKTLWNALVHRYIPGQLVGEGLKASLQFEQIELFERLAERQRETATFGTTITGFSSAYVSLGQFGFIWFFLISYLMKVIYYEARAGSLFHQVLYAYLIKYSLHAITHDHYWFFTPFVQFFVFVGLSFYVARSSYEWSRTHAVKRSAI